MIATAISVGSPVVFTALGALAALALALAICACGGDKWRLM